MATHPIVFEYGYLSCDKKAAKENSFTLISTEAFQYLEQRCLCQEEAEVSQFLLLRAKHGHKVLQVKNYVGVIFTPHGQHIEVLPKIAKTSDRSESAITHSRKLLLMMLKHLGHFRHIITNTANVETLKMPLLEVFIEQFLQSVNQVVKRGLRSDYIQQQDNLAYQKGKLLVDKQIRHNAINKHKFFVEYDEFLQDRPANRLIRAALKKVAGYTKRHQNQRLLRELDFAFDGIPASRVPKQDFAQIKLDRGMSYYHAPLAWSRLILEGFSPLSMKGNANAQSLLFPMEAVFESYVASVLSQQLPEGFQLCKQATGKVLVTHNKSDYFRLKPDLVIESSSESSSESTAESMNRRCAVLDTKWKLINAGKSSSSDKYDLSQSDFYQMFAYGHKYLQGKGDVFLIYPVHSHFEEPLEHSFDFSDTLRLWVVPFVLELDSNSRLIWPTHLKKPYIQKPRV
ncbi:restriction endonuclease [Photobacterium profundum]|uniref:Restriction endonuclease n=1 Tax=Photobacterium profundum 3TCK TaxID=314280 RepID=Q1Z9T2_9GAMM|nr:McrC family protein [Photobacterium profundum]EAS45760.1 hypothetical protein P3TCK_05266 [Photobacterium profundum 3TCK]PSV63107.1 restriction endonuclease [Photobacterium profundum]